MVGPVRLGCGSCGGKQSGEGKFGEGNRSRSRSSTGQNVSPVLVWSSGTFTPRELHRLLPVRQASRWSNSARILTETEEKLLPSTFTRCGPSDAIACEDTRAPKFSNTKMRMQMKKRMFFKPFLLLSSPPEYLDPAAYRQYTAVAAALR